MQIPDIDTEKCLGFLSKLVQIKSYSETSGEIEITDFISQKMKDISLEADVYPFANGTRQNAIGRWKGKDPSKSKTLLFNGHLDTNPVTEGWTVDPWEGKIDEGFIYGIGVSNMKAGCAAYFCAVEDLKSAGWTPKGDIVLTFVVGELQGGVGTMAAIEQGRMNADYFINCEPSDIRAITKHAEALMFEVDLLGVTRHMSAAEEAADSILAACALIPELDKMTFSGAKSEDHKRCNRCLVGVVHGALGKKLEEWRPSQVADVCRLAGSARYAPGQTKEGVMRDIEETISRVLSEKCPGVKFELRQRFEPTMPAFEVSADSRIVKSLNKGYHDVRGEEQPTGVLKPTCFYGSDAGHLYKQLGMEGIVCGPGGKYNTRPDEKVDIPDYLDCIRMFMRVIVDICS
ncbi:Zn-dependent exopeptidase [Mollisia scopiformis]|uniref:Zn-dependent exopeptidase n=1 Tax=Mollisia scopiformis TaxID=149040 RepID=A0A194WWP5_MOLSC|nr:Zn-dependent exopeptidase [Mollisia scopiformis]KUJ12393.1 Zn-dependent exopeptidase [Mollisia scopiformis]